MSGIDPAVAIVRRPVRTALLAALIVAAACTAAAARSSGRSAALRAADLAMSQALATGDLDRFAEAVDAEAVWGGPAAFLRGREAVVGAWRRYATPGGPRLTWSPSDAALSADGELGYTTGDFRFEGRDHLGRPVSGAGRYVTVWRRGPDGVPRALFDLELLPPGAAPEARRPVAAVASRARDVRAEIGAWAGPGDARGSYLVVWGRGGDGAEVPLVESIVPSGG